MNFKQMINKLAYLTAKYIGKHIEDTTWFSQIRAKRKKVPYKQLTKQEVIDMMEYSLKAIYGGMIKIILLLICASVFHILSPTLIIACTFGILRPVAGGVHMGTFFNCLGTTTMLFIIGGLLVHNIIDINFINQNIFYLIFLECVLGLYLIKQYAPRDTPNRRITNPKEIKTFKQLSIIFVLIINIIIIILALYKYNIIVLAIIYSLFLEMFVITPIGVKTFNCIESKLNKLFNIKEEE
jgi:accessory gene regulator B